MNIEPVIGGAVIGLFVVLVLYAVKTWSNRESLVYLISKSPSVCFECRVLEMDHDIEMVPAHEFVPGRLVLMPEHDLR